MIECVLLFLDVIFVYLYLRVGVGTEVLGF